MVGGVGGMLTFLARCTNIDATQQGGGVVGGVGGMLTFLARCTNTAHVFIRYHWVFLLLQCHLSFLKKYVPSKNKENKSCVVGLDLQLDVAPQL